MRSLRTETNAWTCAAFVLFGYESCYVPMFIHTRKPDCGRRAKCASAATWSAEACSPTSRSNQHCLPASVAFLESDGKASDEMQKCVRGDTVVSDFSKAIVATGENVSCVLALPKRVNK